MTTWQINDKRPEVKRPNERLIKLVERVMWQNEIILKAILTPNEHITYKEREK